MSLFESFVIPSEVLTTGKPYVEYLYAVVDGNEVKLPTLRTSLNVGDHIEATYSAVVPVGNVTKVALGTAQGCFKITAVSFTLTEPTELRFIVSCAAPNGLVRCVNPFLTALVGGGCAVGDGTLTCEGEQLTVHGACLDIDGVRCFVNPPLLETVAVTANIVSVFKRPYNASYDALYTPLNKTTELFNFVTREGMRYNKTAHTVQVYGYTVAEYGVLAVDSVDGVPYIAARRGIVMPFSAKTVAADTDGFRAFRAVKQNGVLRFCLLTESGLTVYGSDGSELYTSAGNYSALAASEDFILAHTGANGVWLNAALSNLSTSFIYELLIGEKEEEGFAANAYYRFNPSDGVGFRYDRETNQTVSIVTQNHNAAATDGRMLAVSIGENLTVKDLKTGEETAYSPSVGFIDTIAVTRAGLFVKGTTGSVCYPPYVFEAYVPAGKTLLVENGTTPTTFSMEVS